MPKSISAYSTKDGRLFGDRTEAENHEITTAIIDKFGDNTQAHEFAREILHNRFWLEAIFAEARKEQTATYTFAAEVPSDLPAITDPAVEELNEQPPVRMAS